MFSKNQKEILKVLKENQEEVIINRSDVKNILVNNHKDENYFPSEFILGYYDKLKNYGYKTFVLYNNNLDSLYVAFLSTNKDLIYFISGNHSATIKLLNIHPFYNIVFDREREYVNLNLQKFTIETLSKEIIEESINKCDNLFVKYNNLIDYYYNKAKNALKNLWYLKNNDPIYAHMEINQANFSVDCMFFNATLNDKFFTYNYTYFMHESFCDVKLNYRKIKEYDDFYIKNKDFDNTKINKHKDVLKLINKIKKDTLII